MLGRDIFANYGLLNLAHISHAKSLGYIWATNLAYVLIRE